MKKVLFVTAVSAVVCVSSYANLDCQEESQIKKPGNKSTKKSEKK